MTAHQGQLKRVISSRGAISYEIELSHSELHKHRVIRGSDPLFVLRKAEMQLEDWAEQWERKRIAQTRSQQAQAQYTLREQKRRFHEDQKHFAAERTEEARQVIENLGNTLRHALSRNDAIDWEQLKDHSPFPKLPPSLPAPPKRPVPARVPREPVRTDLRYQVQLSLVDKLLASRRARKENAAAELFERDHEEWEAAKRQTLAANASKEQAHLTRLKNDEIAHEQATKAWSEERDIFSQQQQEQNAVIERQKEQYLAGSQDAVLGYCDMVLSNSEYPDFLPKEWELDLNMETGVLIVDYSLPAPEQIPTLVEVKYIATKEDFTEKHLSAAQAMKLYDDLLYQITLRTIHELFEADVIEAIRTIVFNGFVRSIDKGTGNEVNACVLSLQTKREEFLTINLANIDPKTCFRQLKGVGSSKLHSITPVAPIVNIRRDDGRFVSSYDVAYQLDEGYNLAAMDWQDFEHLIREVFGKEFSSNGGEVKVTQASRDGGVDAVAFDPDPIRGGKIVIQAKRYTATVGVAAVRDLYGTVMNEGATKGILITTSDYGPDAYQFANGKPLTLLNGANLLHLLEKHGHKAKIDLREARQQALERSVK